MYVPLGRITTSPNPPEPISWSTVVRTCARACKRERGASTFSTADVALSKFVHGRSHWSHSIPDIVPPYARSAHKREQILPLPRQTGRQASSTRMQLKFLTAVTISAWRSGRKGCSSREVMKGRNFEVTANVPICLRTCSGPRANSDLPFWML